MSTIVFLTGATKGSLGYAIVQALLASDKRYTIYMTCRDIMTAQEAADSLKAELKEGDNLIPLSLDLENDESISKAVDKVSKEGRLDILINNAGIKPLLVY
jgi:NAD(P)-dependent dehydrogenase (short-subunit alcohol dehydrogenase family)